MAVVTENSNTNTGETPGRKTEPRGFGEHTRGLAGEYAHEQGWQLEEEERCKLPDGPQNTDGGTDYDYGARDFGDEPVHTAVDESTVNDVRKNLLKEAK